jgi:hypothetical protein
MNVGEPAWFELDYEGDLVTFERMLTDYVHKCGMPTILLIVLKNDK